MAKDLRLDVITTEDGRGLHQAADDLDHVANKTDKVGEKFKGATQEGSHLDAEIERVRQKTKELGQEFEATGNKDVFKELRKNINYGNQLEKVRNDLRKTFTDVEQDVAVAGERVGKNFFSRFLSSAKNQGESLGKDFSQGFEKTFGNGIGGFFTSPGGIAVAIPVAIEAGTMIGGALLTGIGLAGIGVGIAGQIHDPRVQAAAANLGKDLSAGFKDATSAFRDPTVAAINEIDHQWKQFQPSLKKTFTDLAPLVLDLERGAVGFGENLVKGLEHAAEASKPLVRDFSSWLPRFGDQLGHVFDAAASHSGAALQGLHAIEDTLSGFAAALPPLIAVDSTLASVLGKLSTYGQVQMLYGKKATDSARVSAQSFGDAMFYAATGMDKNASAAQNDAMWIAKLNQQMKDAFSIQMNVDEATLQWHKDLTTLVTDIDKHGKSLNENTAAGQKNIGVLLQLAQDAERMREAAIDQAGGVNASKAAVDAANASYQANIKTLEAVAVKLGLSKDAVKALLDQYIALAKQPDINKNINLHQHFDSSGNPAGGAGQSRGSKLAAGGPVKAGQQYIVGDAGRPELFVPNSDGYVFPEVPKRGYGRLVQNAGGDGAAQPAGAAQITINLVTPAGRVLWSELVQYALDTGRTPAALFPDRR